MFWVEVLPLGFQDELYLISVGSLFSVKYAIKRRLLIASNVELVTTLCTSPALMPTPTSFPEIFGSAKSILLQIPFRITCLICISFRCFPEAEHIYYAQSNPTKLSIVEIGRVIQIVTGIVFLLYFIEVNSFLLAKSDQAHRLDKEVQIAFVEHFLKSIPATGATRIFIHNKQRLQQRK